MNGLTCLHACTALRLAKTNLPKLVWFLFHPVCDTSLFFCIRIHYLSLIDSMDSNQGPSIFNSRNRKRRMLKRNIDTFKIFKKRNRPAYERNSRDDDKETISITPAHFNLINSCLEEEREVDLPDGMTCLDDGSDEDSYSRGNKSYFKPIIAMPVDPRNPSVAPVHVIAVSSNETFYNDYSFPEQQSYQVNRCRRKKKVITPESISMESTSQNNSPDHSLDSYYMNDCTDDNANTNPFSSIALSFFVRTFLHTIQELQPQMDAERIVGKLMSRWLQIHDRQKRIYLDKVEVLAQHGYILLYNVENSIGDFYNSKATINTNRKTVFYCINKEDTESSSDSLPCSKKTIENGSTLSKATCSKTIELV